MTIHLVVEVSDEVLKSVSDGGTVVVRIVRGDGVPSGGGTAAPAAPAGKTAKGEPPRYRAGTLPARLVDWAGKRGGEFATTDVVDLLGISRAHASMLLTKLADDAGPVRRVTRGIYACEGAPAAAAPAPAKPARRKTAKKTRRKTKKKVGKKK